MTRTLLLALALAGCHSPSFHDPMHASGSRTIAASEDRDLVVAVNVEEGTVTVSDADTYAAEPVFVGSEPTRIANVGNRFFVTLRGEGSLAVLELEGDTARVIDRLSLGSEPFGVVATEDGDVFVALAGEDEVVGIDAATLEAFGRWSVPHEPRWLAASSQGVVYAASVKQAALHQIDVARDRVTPIALPAVTRANLTGEAVPLTNRITGDPSVSPDGKFLAIPVLSVDNTSTGNERDEFADTSYVSQSPGPGRFNPGVALVGLRPNGRASGPLSMLSAVVASPFPGSEFGDVERSFPSAAIFSPGSDTIVVPMEGSHLVAVLSLREEFRFEAPISEARFYQHGFATPRTTGIPGPTGTRSLTFVNQGIYVAHGWLDRSVQRMWTVPRNTRPQIPLEVSRFPVSIERGRHAFNTATDSVMQAPGSGVTCATCHFDGLEDGLSWPLELGPRQTMSLGGVVSETLPVTWNGFVSDVETEARRTSGDRMGGHGADPALAADIAAYIDIVRAPYPSWRLDSDAVARGEAIFARDEVGCAECHPAPTFEDGARHLIFGELEMNTPTLRGLARSAPYFHDGSAADLDAVLSRARLGQMGDIRMLDDSEVDDLRAYLASL